MPAGIAYRARLREPALLDDLIEHVRATAEVRGWVSAEAPPVTLAEARLRGLDGNEEPRHGLTARGIWVNPHFASDDLGLVFDVTRGELVDTSRVGKGGGAGAPLVLGFGLTLTTWADAATHVALIALLEDLAEHDLASVELGDPEGKPLARDLTAAAARLDEARREALRLALARPDQPFRAGRVEFLPPAEAARRRQAPPGPLDLVPAAERDELRRSRQQLLAAWAAEMPGLDGPPDVAAAALERLTDQLLSHPALRRDTTALEDGFAWESGVVLGFLLIEALGGHWERVEGVQGPILRVANLGGTGLTWEPLASARERLTSGPLYAHDLVLAWLRSVAAAARPLLA